MGVDNRTPAWAWVALDGGAIGKIPADMPDGTSNYAAAPNVFSTGASGTLGAGVAIDLDIWGINQGTSSATHFPVDAMGNVTLPTAADQVTLDDNPANGAIVKPQPYTYS